MDTHAASSPVVSVLVTAYNHAPFVSRALESVLEQQTDFACEVLVGDDGSTDGTRELIGHFADRYPDRIRPWFHTERLGECGNLAALLGASSGQYVALLDGDDFWISPLKLRKQVSFLDRNGDCAMCCHNALAFYQDGGTDPYLFCPPTIPARSTLSDLWRGNFVPTCSAMIRRSTISSLPSWYWTMPWGDWPLYVLAAERGRIGYLDEVLGVYRVHRGGAWSGLGEAEQVRQVLEFYRAINVHLEYRYDAIITPLAAEQEAILARLSR